MRGNLKNGFWYIYRRNHFNDAKMCQNVDKMCQNVDKMCQNVDKMCRNVDIMCYSKTFLAITP